MKRLLFAIACLLLFAGHFSACGKVGGGDKAKMEACKSDPKALETGEGCEACCKGAGASGHSWMNLGKAECECL